MFGWVGMRDHSAWSVSDGAKLYTVVIVAMCVSGCGREHVLPVYDASGAIRRIDYDNDGDGHVEMRAYLQAGRTVRIEADGNGDAVVDRWEYYRPDGQLERLGT